MMKITLLPCGRYMDGPEKGKIFKAHDQNDRYVRVMCEIHPGEWGQVMYVLKWWQYKHGAREARYYLTEESARMLERWNE